MGVFSNPRLASCCAGVLFLTGAYAVERRWPSAGFWTFFVLSISVGFVHGALDSVLLLGRAKNSTALVKSIGTYLLAVCGFGAVFAAWPSAALLALLAMSAWHFGEPYARWQLRSTWGQILTRAVVGAAPVMLPMLLHTELLQLQLQAAWPEGALQVWQASAGLWAACAVLWLSVWIAAEINKTQDMRWAGAELLGVLLLNALLSPLMAFAVYFGLYHAPVHIWRVWRSHRASPGQTDTQKLSVNQTVAITVATFAATLLLAAALWWAMGALDSAAAHGTPIANALRWLVVALAALTAPHLVLVSACADRLARGDLGRGEKVEPAALENQKSKII